MLAPRVLGANSGEDHRPKGPNGRWTAGALGRRRPGEVTEANEGKDSAPAAGRNAAAEVVVFGFFSNRDYRHQQNP